MTPARIFEVIAELNRRKSGGFPGVTPESLVQGG